MLECTRATRLLVKLSYLRSHPIHLPERVREHLPLFFPAVLALQTLIGPSNYCKPLGAGCFYAQEPVGSASPWVGVAPDAGVPRAGRELLDRTVDLSFHLELLSQRSALPKSSRVPKSS